MWDSGKDPFQSYDLILVLRNELVHFKGRVLRKGEIPVRKLKALAQRFKGTSTFVAKALRANNWVHELLTARELSNWIADVIYNFDLNWESYITGRKLSKNEKRMREMHRALNVPFPKFET